MRQDIERKLRRTGIEREVIKRFKEADYLSKRDELMPNQEIIRSELLCGLIRVLGQKGVSGLHRALVDIGHPCAQGISLNNLYQKALARGYIT